MLGFGRGSRTFSWSIILGFACNQAFLYSLFYLEPNQSLALGALELERVEHMGALAFMCLSLYAVASLPAKQRGIALSPRFVLAYSIILVLGAGVPAFVGTQDLISIAYESICVGVPSALMLCAWGRALGSVSAREYAHDVILGLGLGAAICCVFALIPIPGAYSVLYFAPLGSALLLRKLASGGASALDATRIMQAPSSEADVAVLSLKILLGTACFGFAVGLVEAVSHRIGSDLFAAPLTFLLFVLFCIAALQLFQESASSKLAGAGKYVEGPLDGSYRLAVLLLISGLLLTPVLDRYLGISGETIVLSGYLALTTVLVSLFLVMAHVLSYDSSLAFARGFLALFAGEFIGLLAGNMVDTALPAQGYGDLLVAAAGIIVLVGYLFLFTNRDMKALSVAVESVDVFELAVARIIDEFGLSKRESEILPFVLRGRSSERIASELYISKNTVDTHIRKIYAKCSVHSKQGLLDLAEGIQAELRA